MLILLIIFFLALSAIFSGTEIAFVSASKLRVELKRQKGSRKGAILASFFDKPAQFLSTMLVGNNIALVVFTYLMAKLLTPLFEPYFQGEILILLSNTLVVTVIVLIFGEFFPKTLFRLFAEQTLYFLAYPLLILKYLLILPSFVMTKTSSLLLKYLFRTPDDKVESAFTRLDLENFIKDTAAEYEEEIDTDLFGRALYLNNTKIKEAMVPRNEIQHIDVNEGVEELKKIFTETKLSRILISKDELDNVIGYVHHQQMLNSPQSIEELVMEISFIPEAMRVLDAMNKFINSRINIACVVDEYGVISGLITLEDILEEIFGEIEDEHDQEEHVENMISENEFLFSGRLEIDYINDKYPSINLPEGDYHTLSGYIVMTTGTIPEQGAVIELDNYKFILELVSDKRIITVRVLKLYEHALEMD